MPRSKKAGGGLSLFLGLAVAYGFFFAARLWWSSWSRAIHLQTARAVYHHDDLIEIRLWSRDPGAASLWGGGAPAAVVTRAGLPVTTVGGLTKVPLARDPKTGDWIGRWPCPWNAEAGRYGLTLAGSPAVSGHLRAGAFRIERRRPHPLPAGFSVVTLEAAMPVERLVVVSPSGERKDWTGLLDWAQFVGADALWMLAGRSPGKRPGQTWADDNDAVIPKIARECRRRGLKFGVYAMCYLTLSKDPLPRYQHALDVKDGKTVPTRAISLNDPQRPADVAELLKTYAAMPDVDYIGLDYIRNALGGYELAEDFYKEMPGVAPPAEWPRLSQEERRVYFARKKIMRRDQAFIDAWQWWRAHRVASVVRLIKAAVGEAKPLWAFTLTWQRGWHHGQDVVMMNDAGVDADALMLYEANREQFDVILRDWRGYAKRSDAQLVVGNVIDWPLHQGSPDGPREFGRRMREAIGGVYADGPAAGIFFHDLGRALYGGRLGPWGARGWLEEARNTVRHFKSLSGAGT